LDLFFKGIHGLPLGTIRVGGI